MIAYSEKLRDSTLKPNKTNKIVVTLVIIVGEGNGNPFQYSCLENPMDSGAWWAAVNGVTKGWA